MASNRPITSRLLMDVMVLLCCAVAVSVSLPKSHLDKEQFTFYDSRQEEFVKSLEDYVFTVPARVTSAGDFLTHKLHAKHVIVKRHADSSQLNPNDIIENIVNGMSLDRNGTIANTKFSGNSFVDSETDIIHYRIPVHDGKEVIVRLRENNRLLSPSAVVETKTRRYLNVSDSTFGTLRHRRGCHLTGEILGDLESRVALTACDGLAGFFHTDGEQYIIEPLKGHNPDSDPEHRHPHVVYKRSALSSPPDRAFHRKHVDSFCPVHDNDDRVSLRRERWEKTRIRRQQKEEHETGVGNSRKRRRKKRSISSEKNVETLIVVDPDMMRYYQNEDIENYVLTVMNMVATLFHDASIGNAINIVIVRMLLLKDPDEDLEITHHADNTLRSFCFYQKSVNFRDDDHPNHHDVALLLTRRNICNRMNQPCNTLGLAQVSGMCQPHRSCNINEDTGLSLAWTVTHELGHNFAMKHDSKQTDCASPPGEMYVMSPHLSWDLTPAHWSTCSRASVTKFLDRDWGYCLDDEPSHHPFEYPVLPAGTMYDADHQCRLLYGEDAALCGDIQDLENICSTLWCRVNNKCSTKLQPAAEGTICGTNKWCFAGKCVEIGDRPQAINGEWGEWGEWTSCSRSCGAGVTHSERHCNHPPPSNGGNYCLGERKRYRICNTESCAEDDVSFRHVQCAEFNNIPYKESMYDWIPLATPETPCQLHCKPRDMFFSVLLKDIVTDGTPCVPGTRHMCISGRCRHVGCDWEIDSSATEDRCGVCYGDGSTCISVKQQFNETKEHGYVQATVIPQGARNIRVEEVASASNFLALANDEGEYYLNGHWFIQWSGDYEMAGTVVHYDREGNKESFKAQGPLKEPLHIMLLMQTHNPGVVFEYTVPKENATDTREPEFRWDSADWSHCTLSCGGGTQRSEVSCVEKEAGRVDDRFCNQTSKPDDRLRSCNEHLCPARWWTGPWQHCSVTCGDNGTHKRSVMCVRSLGEAEQIALEDAACGNFQKPDSVEPCTKEPCPGSVLTWMTGNWTQCNGNPCATQTRTVVCSDVTEGCDPFDRPAASRPCTNVTCGTWRTDNWSACTRTCQGGVQYRKVTCIGGNTCNLELEPPDQQPCGTELCPEPKVDNSSETENIKTALLPTDGIYSNLGESTEEELLVLSNSSSHLPLHTEGRNESTNIFLDESSLNQNNLHQKEVLFSSSHAVDLSSTKSQGSRESTPAPNHKHRHSHRTHSHQHNRSDQRHQKNPEIHDLNDGNSTEMQTLTPDSSMVNENQTQLEKLETDDSNIAGHLEEAKDNDVEEEVVAEEQKGEVTEEDFEWYAGDWRKCSSDCGDGVQTRTVSCFRKTTGDRVDSEFCSIHTKPSAIRECNADRCVEWLVAKWGECSATCGYATRYRNVTCPAGKRCDPKFKPRDMEVCSSLSPCIIWVTGDWSKCSKTCDGGTQKRMVQCVDLTSQQVVESCDVAIKPSERQSCNIDQCPSTDSAFSVNCETNEMSFKVCRMLKKVGLCHKDYVQAKCCRTCADHSRQSPANRIADLR